MAIAVTHLTSGQDTGGSSTTSYTASFTPATNSLVLLLCTSNDITSPNISPGNGNGLTWANIFDANIYINGVACGLWRAMASSPSSGSIAISHDAALFSWEILEFTGVDTSGSNGSGAVVQSGGIGTSAGTPTITFGSATGASNAIAGFIGVHDNSVTIGPGSGFTTIASGGDVLLTNKWLSEWKNGVSQTTCSFTQDSGTGVAFGLEIAAGGGGVPTTGAPSGLVVGAGF